MISKMNYLGATATAMVLMLTSSIAWAFEKPEDGVYADHIDWGVTSDMSGPATASQLPWFNGLNSYIKTFNESGGVYGRKINIIGEDNRMDISNERIAIEKFINQTPVLAMSGNGLSAQVAVLPLLKKAKLPVIGSYVSAKPMIEPANPYFYGGFCGLREMAQVGVGYMVEKLKLKNPKIAFITIDTASGNDFFADIEAYLKATGGGTVTKIPIKVVAADATPQVLELVKDKPDFVYIYGVVQTSILTMKAMQQYGLNIPAVTNSYLGTPGAYESMGREAGKNYTFVSCFTPGSSDEKASVDMVAAAKKYGFAPLTDDINFVAGWVVGNLVVEALKKVGPEPTREKLVEMMNAGFELDTKGLSSQLKYTPDNHAGFQVLKAFGYNYDTNKFVAYGEYKDYAKYLK